MLMVNRMITIYAEKFDVGAKIAAALGGFDHKGTLVTMDNIEKLTTTLKNEVKPKGFIKITYEGQEYAVTWGQGHMYTLKSAKDYNEEYEKWSKLPMPFFPEQYEIKLNEGFDRTTGKPTGSPHPWTSKQMGIVSDLIQNSDSIINATDYDREGEVIFAYVYEMAGHGKPYKRVLLDSQTEDGFRNAFNNLIDSSKTIPVEEAGRCRSIADWVVGINLTVMMSLKYGRTNVMTQGSSVISVGRVQTPVLNILVERENEILNFKPEDFWNIQATFKTPSGEDYVGRYTESQIKDRVKVDGILSELSEKQGTVTSYEKTDYKSEVPYLYNLTTLSMTANEKYGMTAQETLNAAQELYTAGVLTYPRTVSQHLTSDMTSTVDEVIDMLATYSDEYAGYISPVANRNYTKRHFDTSKVESHYAIIPTKAKPGILTGHSKNIYDLVAKSLIRVIYGPAVGEKTKIVTSVGEHQFNTSGTIVTDKQWLVVSGTTPSANELPVIKQGDMCPGDYIDKPGKTTAPKRYTDKTLLGAMYSAGKQLEESALKEIMIESGDGGIGTEATRASIIETVISRKYAERSGKNIIPTEKGMVLIDILPLKEIKSAELTANWELRLKEIEKGTETIDNFIKDIQTQTNEWVNTIKNQKVELAQSSDATETNVVCPCCSSPVVELNWGWACSTYNREDPTACKFALLKTMSGVSISKADLTSLATTKRSKLIKNFKKKDSNDKYSCYLIVNDDGSIGRSFGTGVTCPKCKERELYYGKMGISCPGYQEGCSFTVWHKTFGKMLSETDKMLLITKGTTGLIKGFEKKAGGTYDAILALNEEFVVGFAPRKK